MPCRQMSCSLQVHGLIILHSEGLELGLERNHGVNGLVVLLGEGLKFGLREFTSASFWFILSSVTLFLFIEMTRSSSDFFQSCSNS
jgi:hypothetical protein